MVDAPSTRDIDDALSVLPAGPDGALRLLVSIADVGEHVAEGSAQDVEARERATSVYLAGRVLPMLPEELSSQWLSLVPGEDRRCLTVKLRIDPQGRGPAADVYESVIRSWARPRCAPKRAPPAPAPSTPPSPRPCASAAPRLPRQRRGPRGGRSAPSGPACTTAHGCMLYVYRRQLVRLVSIDFESEVAVYRRSESSRHALLAPGATRAARGAACPGPGAPGAPSGPGAGCPRWRGTPPSARPAGTRAARGAWRGRRPPPSARGARIRTTDDVLRGLEE